MAWVPSCLCHCSGGEYSHDDDRKFNRILCGFGWNHGLTQGYSRELLRYLLSKMKTDVGLAFVAAVFAALFIAVQVMFEIREDEKRRGINLRC